MRIFPELLESADEIREIRRDIHAHPELMFEELRTSQKVIDQLSAWGIEVHSGLGKTGVVGRIVGNQGPGKSIGLRADMDALPLMEQNTFAHTSRHQGKMHACGHDGHTAMLLGAAKYLATHRDFKGTVNLIFQPAEEGGGGALQMMRDGLFEKFPCDAVFGMHNWPGMPEGHFGVVSGPMMASSNEFKIMMHGRGAHAALPHNGADPIMAVSQLVTALQSIVTRNKNPIDVAVLSVTQIHAGEATNIIPDEAWIGGTIRTFTTPVLDLMEDRLRSISEAVATSFECKAEIQFERNYPPLINHASETAFALSVIEEFAGQERIVKNTQPTMGAEDFAFMLEKVPGCYVFIGNGDGIHREIGHGLGRCNLHNPSYDFNDRLIPIGASYWINLAMRFLQNQ